MAGFDIDVHAAFKKRGVKAREQTVYVDDETVIRMDLEKDLAYIHDVGIHDPGNTDDVCCVPVVPRMHPGTGDGNGKGRNRRRVRS